MQHGEYTHGKKMPSRQLSIVIVADSMPLSYFRKNWMVADNIQQAQSMLLFWRCLSLMTVGLSQEVSADIVHCVCKTETHQNCLTCIVVSLASALCPTVAPRTKICGPCHDTCLAVDGIIQSCTAHKVRGYWVQLHSMLRWCSGYLCSMETVWCESRLTTPVLQYAIVNKAVVDHLCACWGRLDFIYVNYCMDNVTYFPVGYAKAHCSGIVKHSSVNIIMLSWVQPGSHTSTRMSVHIVSTWPLYTVHVLHTYIYAILDVVCVHKHCCLESKLWSVGVWKLVNIFAKSGF